jgi:thiamine biosynthesis lipoprotein
VVLAQLRFEAMGSECHLCGVGVAAGRLEWGRRWVEERDRRFSRFSPTSEVSRLNAAGGRWVEVSPELEAMLRLALQAHEDSSGLVHAGVMASMVAIGYSRPLRLGPTPPGDLPPPPPPLPETLEVAPGRARLRVGTGIDLGGLAKGWLADRLAFALGANCLVNLGGDLFARGPGPTGRGWPVGLGPTVVLLRDLGAATSSTRRRRWRFGGRFLHHLIDPRTGAPAPVQGEVSVVAASAAAAEVLAKTALLLGHGAADAYLDRRAEAWLVT